MNYILDTNVISELVSPSPEGRVISWVDSLDPESLFLSVITIGELQKGISKLARSKRKTKLVAWLENDLLVRFQDRIISLDVPILLRWGKLVADLEAKGRRLPAIDSLLAATAAETGFKLVTRNVVHFEFAGIDVINPWRDSLE
jgi:predicted nucleic acid-binding protein